MAYPRLVKCAACGITMRFDFDKMADHATLHTVSEWKGWETLQ